VVARATRGARHRDVRLGLRVVRGCERAVRANLVGFIERADQALRQPRRHRRVPTALRAHGDQPPAQQLDAIVLVEHAALDELVVRAARQPPPRENSLGQDEVGIQHQFDHSILPAALSEPRASRTARDRSVGCPERPVLGQLSEARVAGGYLLGSLGLAGGGGGR